MTDEHNERTIFSVLYSESNDYLSRLIDNFLGYTDTDSFLVVNLPPYRKIELPHRLQSERIFVINGDIPREKWGHTLLIGHLESFQFATQTIGDFGYFCTLASNSLFVRKYDKAATVALLEKDGVQYVINQESRKAEPVFLDNLPPTWHWFNLNLNSEVKNFIQEKWGLSQFYSNQIEGLLANRSDWETLHSRKNEIIEVGQMIRQDATLPMEEILPLTFFMNFGSGKCIHICYMFWNRNFNGEGLVSTRDLIDLDNQFLSHISVLKWFRRSPAAAETYLVTQDWCRLLLSRLNQSRRSDSHTDLLMQRLILERIANDLRSKEIFVPIASAWPQADNVTDTKIELLQQNLTALRQLIPLGALSQKRDFPFEAYLLMEDTRHTLNMNIHIERSGETRVHIDCSSILPDKNNSTEESLEGYIYLSPLIESSRFIFRLRVLSQEISGPRIASRIVIFYAEHYSIIPPAQQTDFSSYSEYYYDFSGTDKGGHIWFGMPIYAGAKVSGVVDFVAA